MSDHSEVFDLLDTVVGDMKRRREPSVNPNNIGDKLAGLLDPRKRSPHLAAYAQRMQCRAWAREYMRTRQQEEQAAREAAQRQAQCEFELEPYCPTGKRDEWVLREEMTLDERWAFSASLGSEIVTKTEHKRVFDAETEKMVREKYFDDKGRPKNSRRSFDEAA
jgi:hypothetical protein